MTIHLASVRYVNEGAHFKIHASITTTFNWIEFEICSLEDCTKKCPSYWMGNTVSTGIEPAISCVTGRRVNRYTTRPNYVIAGGGFEPPTFGLWARRATELLHPAIMILMAEEEGFEPPRAVKPLSVFKTDPFSRTWVFLLNYMDLAGFEPATERLWAVSSDQLS